MKNDFKKVTLSFWILCIVIFFSCKTPSQNDDRLSNPKISYGNAVISGKISSDLLEKLKTNEVALRVSSPISSYRDYKTSIQKDGTFRIQIPMICEGIASIEFGRGNVSVLALVPNDETALNISDGGNGSVKIGCKNSLNYAPEDIEKSVGFYFKYWQTPSKTKSKSNVSLEEYKKYILAQMKQALVEIEASSLSAKGKQECFYEMKIGYLKMLFNYNDYLFVEHKNWLSEQHKTIKEVPFVELKSDKSYYTFLKEFDLNDPNYCFCPGYHNLVEIMLEDSTLNIPSIGDQSVNVWLTKTKSILKDALGFDKGWFYDMLVANAYNKCLMYRQPFTDTQKKNISNYFTNDSYTKFLFNENKELLADINRESSKKVVVNVNPYVSKERFLDKIIKKYKGKVVYVDFWATWCAPCLNGLKKFEPIKKKQLKGLNVVYIYIADNSSPKDKWQVKIHEIEGEHYYIDSDIYSYILDQLHFTNIPTSLIYDKQGVLKHKQTVMPEQQAVKWIKELL